MKKNLRFSIYIVVSIVILVIAIVASIYFYNEWNKIKIISPIIEEPSGTVGEEIRLDVKGTYRNPKDLIWKIDSNTTNELTIKVNSGYNKVQKESVGTFLITPTKAGTFSFTIYAEVGKRQSESISITLTVLPKKEVINYHYVAIGDSIATGRIGLGNEEPYVTKFKNYLEKQFQTTITYDDYSHNGDQSFQLLKKLQTDVAIQKSIQSADLITISIGGNNLMYAARKSSGMYDFNAIDYEKAKLGRSKFESDWPVIIETIKKLNPNAKLLVMTVYNPYNTEDESFQTINDFITNSKNNGINDLIWKYSSEYSLVDVYSDFLTYSKNNNMKAVTHFYDRLFNKDAKDPHPNRSGQELIFYKHQVIFEQLH